MTVTSPRRTREALMQRYGERYKWLVLLVVGFGMLSAVTCTTSFNIAIPALGQAFGLGQDQAQWTVTGFMAAMTVAMLPTPWLLDRYGFRRVFLTAIVVLAVAGVAGALSSQFTAVVGARVVQGFAAGLLQPLAALSVMRLFPSHSQGRASGVLGFGVVLAPAVAPSLGGVLLDAFGWQAVFLLNLPLCAIAGFLGFRFLPAPVESRRRRFDWPGLSLLLVVTLATIEAVTSLHRNGLASPWTLGLIALVVVCAALFIRHARRAAAPIVQLELFRERSFAMGTLVSFVYGFGLYASTYVIPVFLQHALGYDATSAGFALMPAGFVLALVIPLAGLLADRVAPRFVVTAGLALFVLSFVLFALMTGQMSYLALVLMTVLGRVGLGLIAPALSLATLRYVRPEQLGQSSMITSYLRQLGGVVGVAVVAVFIQWREHAHAALPDGVIQAYSEAFWLIVAAIALALAASARMRPKSSA